MPAPAFDDDVITSPFVADVIKTPIAVVVIDDATRFEAPFRDPPAGICRKNTVIYGW
jgi:hypothetical protein